MTKQLLAGAATLALLSGAAAAQTTLETTRTTTVTPMVGAPVDSYTTTKTERTYAPGGAAVEREQSYQSGPTGTVSSSQSKVVRPDGSSETTTSKQWSSSTTVPGVYPPAPISSAYPPAPIPPATTSTTVTTYR